METYWDLARDYPPIVRGRQAYHEAGHLWAAHYFGVHMTEGDLDYPALIRCHADPEVMVWIYTAGVLAEALSFCADLFTATQCDHKLFARFDGLLERMFLKAILSDPLACPYDPGGCLVGLSQGSGFIATQLAMLSGNWRGIDKLAEALLAGDTLWPRQVASHLGTFGLRNNSPDAKENLG